MHQHRHTKSCKKKELTLQIQLPSASNEKDNNSQTIDLVDEAIRKKETLLFTTIESKEYDNSTTFKNFLDELELTKSYYNIEIQSTLKQKPSHTWINIFAKNCQIYGMKI